MLHNFNASIIDDEHECILWLKLEHKYSDFPFLPCVCYLPPENSLRSLIVTPFLIICLVKSISKRRYYISVWGL